MIFDVEKLEHLADEGWLRRQRHPDADLWIYNYTEKTQYERHWTPETLACRGLILAYDGRIVARPFPKFFNLHELEDFDPAEHGGFVATEKIDGSLGIVYHLDGQDFVATRGSFTSEQAVEGTAMLRDYDYEYRVDSDTPLVEIVYPQNRIVVDYGDRRELVLLAVLERDTGKESAMAWSGRSAEVFADADDLQILADQNRPNAEGYVLAFESGVRVKLKHPDYVRLHRIITGVNARHIWEALRAGQDPTTELDGVPDEIYGWVATTVNDLRAEYDRQHFSAAMDFASRPDTDDRRAVAEFFKDCSSNTGVLFKMLDGRPYDDLIWKAIRPEPTTPDTVWNAEVAA